MKSDRDAAAAASAAGASSESETEMALAGGWKAELASVAIYRAMFYKAVA